MAGALISQFQLIAHQFIIRSAISYQFLMGTFFNNHALFYNHYFISIFYSTQPVGYNHYCFYGQRTVPGYR